MHDEYLEKIARVVPFDVQTTKIMNDGWANFVIQINNEWIFRFSRGALTRSQMAVETAFLREFSKVSPLSVPKIEFSGEGFMGYRKIDGVPLKTEVLKDLSEESQSKIARELGEFLTTLHGFYFSHAGLTEFPYGGGDFWGEIWPSVVPLLSQRTQADACRYFEDAFKKMENCSFSKTITHSDLGTSNVFFDPNQKSVAGVIDFGDMCVHDPARDFNGILRNHRQSFTEKVLNFYDRKIEPNFWDRINFYAKKQNFQIIFYAPKFGFQEYVPNCVADIEAMF
jgi:aminoglycoside 2''-phosphotransferase